MVGTPSSQEISSVLQFLLKYDYQDTKDAFLAEIAKNNHDQVVPSLFGTQTENPEPETPTPAYGEEEDFAQEDAVSEGMSVSNESPKPTAQPHTWKYTATDQWESHGDPGYRSVPIDREVLMGQLRDEEPTDTSQPNHRPSIADEDPVDQINPSFTPRDSGTTQMEWYQNLQEKEDEGETLKDHGHQVFYLKVFHRRLRTGFEDTKDFPIRHNDVVAGRYRVVGYIGSAAFSKAVQCVDLVTGSLVCLKIIKNNKDYFDQSLDEVKLIKYINANDPDDSHHVLQMYDFFYFKEHLFIVCELLRENLYEFSKYNRESDEELYFTLPRLQRVARQVLKALSFIHKLRLIHCDLKPENILIQSYSKCLVRLIDFGSSCFTTDHLSSYVQSRSYRAPEVILGLKYDGKIDIWSLGCVIAELFTGQVLFQSDSAQGLLARVMSVFGPYSERMMRDGRHVITYFTTGGLVYRKSDSGQYEVLRPKSTTLEARLGSNDAEFVDFVRSLLAVDPVNRPTAEEAMQHRWLQKHYDDDPFA